jgi:hypothetical protein
MEMKCMKGKVIAIVFLALMVISLIPSIEATSVIDLGTIAYKGSDTIEINQSYSVTIVSIFMPIPSSLTIRKIGFNPITNKTSYYFESQTISVDYTFKNDVKTYLFQDSVSNQTYRFYIDFSNCPVPVDPFIALYKDIYLRYNSTFSNYTTTSSLLDDMTTELNLTNSKLNTTQGQLATVSLNASLAQYRANSLARDKKALQDDILKTQVTAVFLCFFSAVVAVFLGKKFGWLNKAGNRTRKRLDTGYGEIPRRLDNYVTKKNNEITKKRSTWKKTPIPIEEMTQTRPKLIEEETDEETQLNVSDEIDAKIAPIEGKIDKLTNLMSSMLARKPEKEMEKVEYVEQEQEVIPEASKPKKKVRYWDTPEGMARREQMKKKTM